MEIQRFLRICYVILVYIRLYSIDYKVNSSTRVNDARSDITIDNQKMTAHVPPDASDNMRAAVAEEPTKNRVFDINLIFEQIVSQYNTFKNQIESKVYEVLSFQVNFGVGVYTDRRLANTVWSLLESYGFGSIERIINWYDTEERKELMANIVLNNKGYAEKLGYGNETGSMDYLFAARLAVLTFVDWVDREYVENSWISSLAAAFGVNIRLADLVNQVFDISGFVLSSIRDELNKAWEGVKSAGEFIANEVLSTLYKSVELMLKSVLLGFTNVIASFNTNLDIQFEETTGLQVNTGSSILTLNFESNNNGLYFILNDIKISFLNLFTQIELEAPETLSLFDGYNPVGEISEIFESLLTSGWWIFATLIGVSIIKTVMQMPIEPAAKVGIVLGSILTYYISSIAQEVLQISNSENTQKNKDAITEFHISTGLSMLILTPQVIKADEKKGIGGTIVDILRNLRTAAGALIGTSFINYLMNKTSPLTFTQLLTIKLVSAIYSSSLAEFFQTKSKESTTKEDNSNTLTSILKDIFVEILESILDLIMIIISGIKLLKTIVEIRNIGNLKTTLTGSITNIVIWMLLAISHLIMGLIWS
jgi:hypothetical protein